MSSLSFKPSHILALRRIWPWMAAILSGVALIACFPRWNQGWLVWFALTPLIAAIFARSPFERGAGWRVAALGFVAGMTFFTGTFFWLSTTLASLYENRWLLAIAPLVAFVFSFYWAGWSWFVGTILVRRDSDRRFATSIGNVLTAVLGSGAWVTHEWVRERLFGGFGWNNLGIALHGNLPMIQIAEFTGVPGVSFLVVFVNLMAVILVRRMYGEIGANFLKRFRWEFSLTVGLIALVFGFGVRSLLRPELGETVPLQVVVVQPNIPQTEKFNPEMVEKVAEQLTRLTGLAGMGHPKPQLVLWPESSTPRSIFADEDSYRFVIDQARLSSGALLLGTTEFDPATDADYNIAILINGEQSPLQSYRKIHLVPFGEYLPLRPIFSGFVGQLVPSDFTPGREFNLLKLSDPKVRIGSLLCFEDTLGDLTRRFVVNGAAVLVNLANDGWFGQSPAAEQHLANAVFRAIENRRPLVRCGNTGVSGSVDIKGRVERWLPPFRDGFASREVRVPLHGRQTFYTGHGDWFSHGCIFLTLTWLIRGLVARFRRGRKMRSVE